jgi:hypothetical protein
MYMIIVQHSAQHEPQATGHRPQATDDRRQATGDRRQATGRAQATHTQDERERGVFAHRTHARRTHPLISFSPAPHMRSTTQASALGVGVGGVQRGTMGPCHPCTLPREAAAPRLRIAVLEIAAGLRNVALWCRAAV